MATRSLTDVFLLMRNNALQTRHMYSQHGVSDSDQLVSRDDEPPDLEAGAPPPPDWLAAAEEVRYQMQQLQERLAQLDALRQRHLTRPTLDDSSADEQLIEQLQSEITQQLGRAQRSLQQVQRAGQRAAAAPSTSRLNRHVVLALATRLQDLSAEFRSSQGNYLRQHQQREQRSQSYFDAMMYESGSDPLSVRTDSGWTLEDRAFVEHGGPLSEQELLQLEENTAALQQRDREVQELVRSIAELNQIFRDLAQMVSDQGQVVDRIDVHVESAQVRVQQGLRQLQKAERYQRKNRKMTCIMVLAGVVVLLLIILITVKS